MINPQDLTGYLPVRVLGNMNNPVIRWLNVEGISLTEPFFENLWTSQLETITDKVIDTKVGLLESHHGSADMVSPNGFIFHMSRCGSTLLTNMLRRVNATIAHSEPFALDPVFLAISEEQLKRMIELFGTRMNHEMNYVVKFPSYATINFGFFKKYFPHVPKIFLFRDPAKVLMSNLKDPVQPWIYEEQVVGRSTEQILGQNTVIENLALALANTCNSFIDEMDETCFCMNYSQLIEPQSAPKAFESILKKFGFSYSQQNLEYALEGLSSYSKSPMQSFSDINKQTTKIPDLVKQVAHDYLGDSYQRLEMLKVQLDS